MIVPLSSTNHCVQWNLFSNPDASVFIYNVLSKKHELNDEEDFLVLDREIRTFYDWLHYNDE